MKKIFLTLLTVSLLGGASTAVAQDFT
ncbi:D-alanyl-D-alanine carboxypeptidase, partial [Streptococcus pneumoniae]